MQPSLQSTLQGWGVGSLDQDADDLLLLAKHLKADFDSQVRALAVSVRASLNVAAWLPHWQGSCNLHIHLLSLWCQKRISVELQAIVLLGHSTGCQDAVRYVESHSKAEGAAQLAGVVLQAAVRLQPNSAHICNIECLVASTV